MISPGLEGKVAVITGANHGIGAATAKALAAQGVSVFITYLRLHTDEFGRGAALPPEPGEEQYRAYQARPALDVVEAIREADGQAEAWEMDLTEPANIPQLFDRAEAALGPVDILINNATHCVSDSFLPRAELGEDARAADGMPLVSVTAEGIDRHFAVNVRATALLAAEFARRYIARQGTWGRIVSISTDGASCFPTEISYGASKHAIESYTRSAAAELGPHGVTCNILSLGPVQTGWIAREMEEAMLTDIPLRRIGQPEDVANAIVFLTSTQADWITGQLIYVGGGHVMGL